MIPVSSEPVPYLLVSGLIVLTTIGFIAWRRIVITRIAPLLSARIVKALDPRRRFNAPPSLPGSSQTASRRAGVRGCLFSAAYEAIVALALSLPWLLLFVAFLVMFSR